GLDYLRTGAEGVAEQQRSFRAHIEIAKRTGKALQIHDREAHADVLRILKEEGAPEVTIFHCYSGDEAMARECAEAGYYMSFAGNLTFKNADELRRAAAAAPLDRLLTETDAPFLTPHPHRGKPGGPYLTAVTARMLAEVRGMSEEELCSAVWTNAETALGGWD
ncbi:MAG: TatD family hydrolase, partial [Brevibacterium sp.]|nr:TatD family hydrolase [Brevibacterium sp.]